MRIAIDGNIGAGKSTLTDNLFSYLNGKNGRVAELHSEPIDNKLLELFYEMKKKYDNGEASKEKLKEAEFANQFAFLSSNLLRDAKSKFGNTDIHIFDRPLNAHVNIFAKMNLEEKNYWLYKSFNDAFTGLLGIERYDYHIYLLDSVEGLKKKIEKRGREAEKDLDIDYLIELNNLYSKQAKRDCLHNDYSKKTYIIDVSDKNEFEVLKEVLDILGVDYE